MTNNSSIPLTEVHDGYFFNISKVFVFSLTAIFPFYNHVFQMNRERDKAIPVFPIINQIHKSMKIVYIQYYVCVFIGLTLYLGIKSAILGVVIAAMYFEMFYLQIHCNVCYLLLCLLAIQRFLIYFFPKIEQYVTLSEKVVKWVWVWSAHALVFSKIRFEIWYELSLWFYIITIIFNYVCNIIHSNYHQYSKNELSFITKLNKPQRYIMWQLIIIVALKITYIPTLFEVYEDYWSLLHTWRTVDALSTPLSIQLAYLGCNRRNLQTFLYSLKLKNVFKVVCCPWIQRSQVVDQSLDLSRSRSTGVPVY
ncbi:hypothetical protein CRE_23372 [Caenorhabditis remanei]|uniref:Uncharacterized protein n=1 Tax=Caenorhabditis remanei TaxID=31234 RepID=E3MH54_CAERE|nr:hypothetical protein CRE_23372 [Caenorhabditis remanei]